MAQLDAADASRSLPSPTSPRETSPIPASVGRPNKQANSAEPVPQVRSNFSLKSEAEQVKEVASDTAPPPKKKVKTSHGFNATQRIVEIVLESDPGTETYNVHENLLREASTYLNEYLQKLEKAKPLIIRNVRRDTFDTFCSWLYTRKVEIEDITEVTSRVTGGKRFIHLANLLDINGDLEQSIDEKSHGHKAADRVYERLVSCYIFAHEFQATTFQNAIIQQLQRFQRGLRGLKANERILPCLSVVNTAVTSTGGGSAISRWFAASFGTHGHEENLCNELELASGGLHFLAAVLKFIYADRNDKYNQDPMLTQNWCEFHEHDDKAARYACYISQLEWDNPSDEKVLKWKARG